MTLNNNRETGSDCEEKLNFESNNRKKKSDSTSSLKPTNCEDSLGPFYFLIASKRALRELQGIRKTYLH
jgi:hypothetical protein